MLLKLTRNQKKGMIGMGAVTFTLGVRTELTPKEMKYVKDYKMGKTVLYSKEVVVGTGLIGFVAKKAFNTNLTVDDMVNGKSIDCKDIVEMVAIEEQVRQASHLFADVLRTAAQFGGEEVIELGTREAA